MYDPIEKQIERADRTINNQPTDLKDNMDITRLEKVTDKDFDRLKKYHKAYKYLKSLE